MKQDGEIGGNAGDFWFELGVRRPSEGNSLFIGFTSRPSGFTSIPDLPGVRR